MRTAALRTGDPERLGEYDLLGRLGQGGQGAVFLGRAPTGRLVAVKLLHPELTEDDRARARFLRELEVAKQVAPFCTAPVVGADLAGDRPYIVSEYVPGPSLARRVAERGPLTGAALERLAIGTATALVSVHQAGIIHRDFKPHNVLLGPDGPRVIDFGVARAVSAAATLTSRVVGTPAYISPEQIQGEPARTATDVFCWAATMVFAATGRPPFGADSIPAVINRVLHHEPDLGELAELDGPLCALVADCLAKDPAERPVARRVLMRLLGQEASLVEAAELAAPPRAGDAEDRTPTLIGGFPTVLPEGTAPDGSPDETQTAGPARKKRPYGALRPYGKVVAAAAAVLAIAVGSVTVAAINGPARERPSVTTNNEGLDDPLPATPSPSATSSAGPREPGAPKARRPATSAPPATGNPPITTRPPRVPPRTPKPSRTPKPKPTPSDVTPTRPDVTVSPTGSQAARPTEG